MRCSARLESNICFGVRPLRARDGTASLTIEAARVARRVPCGATSIFLGETSSYGDKLCSVIPAFSSLVSKQTWSNL